MVRALALLCGGILALVFILIAVRTLSGEDTWICTNGSWVQHGKPLLPKPSYVCPTVTPEPTQTKKR